ncbi:DUF1513 domain-containing protein [Maritimibacter sp. DP1N21-5]|uniref:DUF1513 domain-containing protein n=1 Tax=Maritimibacter sp. DP1N21-5 TaxID=2836867 RepID=UPI001C47AFB1|nr:DUF1513 domain-containing protein [Maritimibacter sp. DP1N21-5]MBV7410955.1 DUF1513 domain-containing protein [Maritimibacter sp. DP1N21-5]
MATRRGFLAGFLAASATPRLGWASVGSPSFLAAAGRPDGSYSLHGLTSAGLETFSIPLPARGHAACGHPTRAEAIGFARRPGTFALVIDCPTGNVTHELATPKGRQFNGHGAYSADGALLFTSEQMAEGSKGLIGVWDTRDFARIDEVPSHGIGPHEILLMPDGKTLVIANGGIETDGWDREKLNLDRMRPNLTYLGTDGRHLETLELATELHKNSIRHIAIRKDGLVAFAMQWEGEPGAATPLLGLHRRGETPLLAEAPLADELLMQGYAGSIAFAGSGAEVAITSPKGGRVHRFSVDGSFLGAVSRAEVCGLAPLEEGFLATDGLGGMIALGPDGPTFLGRSDVAWDNHLVSLA